MMRALSVGLGVSLFAVVASADTTVPITGIGTHVVDSGFTISTHVDQVTVSEPRLVDVPGFGPAYEIRGTVSGVGWGGAGALVARAVNRHYAYDLGYVARWRPHGSTSTLLMFHHGGPPPIIATLQRDKLEGGDNPNRFSELLGDVVAAVPALLDHADYVSVGRRGLLADGSFSARYLTSEVPPLTVAEVGAIRGILAASPGSATWSPSGLFVGAPVPCSPSTDTITMRDVDRALQLIVADVRDASYTERIFLGQSAGSVAGGGIAFGRMPLGNLSVRTGGNHMDDADPAAGTIFDGFIFNGFVYLGPTQRVDDAEPINAPVFFIQGRADERYQQPVALLAELLHDHGRLEGVAWLYEIKSLTHITRDSPLEVKAPSLEGEKLSAYVSAALQNMRALVRDGIAPPASRMGGRLDGTGRLVFDTVDSPEATTPLRETALDSLTVEPTIIPRPIGALEAARWVAVTGALTHEGDAIAGPAEVCRVGGFKHHFFGSEVVPFTPAQLQALWGKFGGYKACVSDTIDALAAERLYDPRVESPRELAERHRALFAK